MSSRRSSPSGWWFRDRRLIATLAIVVSVGVPGCARVPARSSDTVVDVTVKDFKMLLAASIPSGTVTFVIHGVGPTLHEFNAAKTDADTSVLPLAADDTLDDENSATFAHDKAWEVEGIDIGATKRLTVPITPGRWVFYCNMDGHFRADMVAVAVAS
jgi:uncharacterized cupredoxin-like copper-binding protein